ncbi:hypothetical protein ScPMuIL_015156 [Solemya velum]
MLDFAIFAVTFVGALIVAVIYLYPSSRRPTTIPGLEPTSKEDGNLTDMARAGSIHEFLLELHKDYGPIASFWMGEQFVVSIASPDLFKQHHNVFDRPPELFKLFEPFWGLKSLQYANGAEGRRRRTLYDKAFSHEQTVQYCKQLDKTAGELSKKWSTMIGEEHIPLGQYMAAFALKVILRTTFGGFFLDDKEIVAFGRHFDVCWSEMERRLTDTPDPNSHRQKAFDEALKSVKKSVTQALNERRKHSDTSKDKQLLVDILLENTKDDELLIADSLIYVIGGYHTVGNVLTWCFYFLAIHPDIQKEVYNEIRDVVGNSDVDAKKCEQLKYLKQVLDETMRCAVVSPWAARFQDFDSELGGHKIPKGTPVIHALGVMLHDEKHWPSPKVFDPDRFSPDNVKERPPLAFSPFGFAGKRLCPGQKLAYSAVTVCVVTLLRKYSIKLVEGQVARAVYGLVTHPEEEVWITLDSR